MLIAVLLFNLAAYTLTAIATSLTSTPTVSSSTKLRANDCESLLPGQQQDWLLPAPATTKLCFITNIVLGLTSGALLVNAFLWWMTSATEISVSEELCAGMWNWSWNRGACVSAYPVGEEVREGRRIVDGYQYHSGHGFDWAGIWYNGVSYIWELGLEPERSGEKEVLRLGLRGAIIVGCVITNGFSY